MAAQMGVARGMVLGHILVAVHMAVVGPVHMLAAVHMVVAGPVHILVAVHMAVAGPVHMLAVYIALEVAHTAAAVALVHKGYLDRSSYLPSFYD